MDGWLRSLLVAPELVDHAAEVLQSTLAVFACFEHAFEADAPIQLVLVLEAPVAARVPVLREKLLPVLEELVADLQNEQEK